MGPRGPGGPPGKNGDDVSGLLITVYPSIEHLSDLYYILRKGTTFIGQLPLRLCYPLINSYTNSSHVMLFTDLIRVSSTG